jgi:hypothetical protein
MKSAGLAAALFLWGLGADAFAANVYYVNQAPPETTADVKTKTYSLAERAKDLLNFPANFEPQQDRSGKISGMLMQQVQWQNIGGNKGKSFYRPGTQYLTELNLNTVEKLWQDYKFEGQFFLRKTDDIRIESRRDVRLKDMNVKVFNPKNMLQFGDFYGDFSQFVVSSNVEGFGLEAEPVKNNKIKAIAGRRYAKDLAAGLYQRNIAGGKYDLVLFEKSRYLSKFRIGIQAINSRDDKGSLDEAYTSTGQKIKTLQNTVYSIDGEIKARKYLGFNYEVAGSSVDQDVKSPDSRNTGNAVRLQPSIRTRMVTFRYLYYYVQPKFYTDIGAAPTDKIQHQFNTTVTPADWVSANYTQNFYWNRLGGSPQTRRAYNNESYMSLSVKPLPEHRSLVLRPYVNLLGTNTDDPANQSESSTKTYGVALDDSLGQSTWYGVFYERRTFDDLATNSTNDYYHRFGTNLGQDRQVLARRLYASLTPNFDIRQSKAHHGKKDVTFNLTGNLQFDAFSWCALRSGYNVIGYDGGGPFMDYVNQRTYTELDFTLNRKRNVHLITRGERNVFAHQDDTQRYDETRFVFRFVSNF